MSCRHLHHHPSAACSQTCAVRCSRFTGPAEKMQGVNINSDLVSSKDLNQEDAAAVVNNVTSSYLHASAQPLSCQYLWAHHTIWLLHDGRQLSKAAAVCVQVLSEFLIPTTRPPLSVAPGQGPKHRTVPTYCACSHELFSCWVWLCHAMAALAAQPPIMTRNNAAARQKGNTYISRKSMPACPAGILATAGCCKYCKSA